MARPLTQTRNCERKFLIEELFFSVTDRFGVIQSGNEVFARVAGFSSPSELIGKPHNVIRHPDMPRAVFKLLWDTILAGEPVVAYVKNLAVDGCYYWVLALVLPAGDGFLSVRCKPTSKLLGLTESLYQEMVAIESTATEAKDRQPAMERSAEYLMERLNELGFKTYSEFMGVALATELGARNGSISQTELLRKVTESDEPETLRSMRRVQKTLRVLLKNAESFLHLIEELADKSKFLQSLANSVRIIALNAIVYSHQLDEDGRCLSVITHTLAEVSAEGSDNIAEINGTIADLIAKLRRAVIDLGAASLLTDMAVFFREENTAQSGALTAELQKDEWLTEAAMYSRVKHLIEGLQLLSAPSNMLYTLADELVLILMKLSATRSVGTVEVARLHQSRHFLDLFEEVSSRIHEADTQVRDFKRSLEALRSDVASFSLHSFDLEQNLEMLASTELAA